MVVVVDKPEMLEAIELQIGNIQTSIPMKVVEGKQKGGLDARLLGASFAVTENLVFLDDDDELSADYLEKLDLTLLNLGASSKYVFLPSTKRKWTGVFGASLLNFLENFRSSMPNIINSIPYPHTFSGIFCKAGLLENLKAPSVKAFQDIIFIHCLVKKGAILRHIEELGVNFYQDLKADRNTNNFETRLASLSKLKELKIANLEEIEKIRWTSYFSSLRQRVANGATLGNLVTQAFAFDKKIIYKRKKRFLLEIFFLLFIFVCRRSGG